MRFVRYINEDEMELKPEIKEMVKTIKSDCQPFLKEFSGQSPIFRGTSQSIQTTDIMKIKTRRNRLPKDTPLHLHNTLNEMFEEEFGWKVRSQGVFVSKSEGVSGNYGVPVLFFPIGKYQYVWSPKVKDLYRSIKTDIINKSSEMSDLLTTRDLTKEHITKKFRKKLKKLIKSYKTDKYGVGFSNIDKQIECIFNTSSYYIVHIQDNVQFALFLRELGLSPT